MRWLVSVRPRSEPIQSCVCGRNLRALIVLVLAIGEWGVLRNVTASRNTPIVLRASLETSARSSTSCCCSNTTLRGFLEARVVFQYMLALFGVLGSVVELVDWVASGLLATSRATVVRHDLGPHVGSPLIALLARILQIL